MRITMAFEDRIKLVLDLMTFLGKGNINNFTYKEVSETEAKKIRQEDADNLRKQHNNLDAIEKEWHLQIPSDKHSKFYQVSGECCCEKFTNGKYKKYWKEPETRLITFIDGKLYGSIIFQTRCVTDIFLLGNVVIFYYDGKKETEIYTVGLDNGTICYEVFDMSEIFLFAKYQFWRKVNDQLELTDFPNVKVPNLKELRGFGSTYFPENSIFFQFNFKDVIDCPDTTNYIALQTNRGCCYIYDGSPYLCQSNESWSKIDLFNMIVNLTRDPELIIHDWKFVTEENEFIDF